nr:sterol desaturase family protein [Sphingomonadaceae bacterium]
MTKLPNPVDYAVPAFVLLVFVEMLVARVRDRRR